MLSIYETKDWIESSILLANNLRLVGTRREDAVYFRFEGNDRAVGLIEAYWHGDLKVSVRNFVDAQRRIKDLIHKS